MGAAASAHICVDLIIYVRISWLKTNRESVGLKIFSLSAWYTADPIKNEIEQGSYT